MFRGSTWGTLLNAPVAEEKPMQAMPPGPVPAFIPVNAAPQELQQLQLQSA
jgi:hypothetical protein